MCPDNMVEIIQNYWRHKKPQIEEKKKKKKKALARFIHIVACTYTEISKLIALATYIILAVSQRSLEIIKRQYQPQVKFSMTLE